MSNMTCAYYSYTLRLKFNKKKLNIKKYDQIPLSIRQRYVLLYKPACWHAISVWINIIDKYFCTALSITKLNCTPALMTFVVKKSR